MPLSGDAAVRTRLGFLPVWTSRASLRPLSRAMRASKPRRMSSGSAVMPVGRTARASRSSSTSSVVPMKEYEHPSWRRSRERLASPESALARRFTRVRGITSCSSFPSGTETGRSDAHDAGRLAVPPSGGRFRPPERDVAPPDVLERTLAGATSRTAPGLPLSLGRGFRGAVRIRATRRWDEARPGQATGWRIADQCSCQSSALLFSSAIIRNPHAAMTSPRTLLHSSRVDESRTNGSRHFGLGECVSPSRGP